MSPNMLFVLLVLWASHDSLGTFLVYAAGAVPGQTTESQLIRFTPVQGRLRIDGTSNLDDWQVETKTVQGTMEAGPGFPWETDLAGPVNARVEAFIDARSLKSIERDGKPFSNKMDGIMHEALKAEANPKIVYRLDRLLRKSSSKSKEGPCQFEAQGRLVVAGVTNEISMPLNVLTLAGDQLRVWGITTVKMTDFHIDPPSPRITLGIIKTGDEVKLSFEWVLTRRN
jgi:hypothetical protein